MPKFLSQIDTAKIPVKGLTPEQSATFPASPSEGQMVHRTDLKQIYAYLNGGWILLDNSNVLTSGSAAGGDLTGTYPNPTIANGKITGKQLAPALIPNGAIVDGITGTGAAATPTLRALGYTSSTAMPGTATLDQIASGGTTAGNVNLNNFKLTSVADPTLAQDAATKAYVDSVAQGLDAKQSVYLGTTGAETYTITSGAVSSISGTTIDGVSVSTGNRILIKNAPSASGAGAGGGSANTSQPANGIYVVTAVSTNISVARANDMGSWLEVPNAFVFVESGPSNADNGFVCTSDTGGTLNTTAIAWTQFSGAGQITVSAPLAKSGNNISLNTVPITSGGTGATTAVGARNLLSVPTIATFSVGALTAGTWTTVIDYTTPGGNSIAPVFRDQTTGEVYELDWRVNGAILQVRADIAVAANTIYATVTSNN